MTDSKAKEVSFTRFVLSQRIEHILLVISFGMLCLTGLPQRFSGAGWAQWILGVLGGLDTARLLHHIFAFMAAFHFLYHMISTAYDLLFVKPRPTSMVPGVKDGKDIVASVKYLTGRSHDKPRFDRYDFRQKMEYWAMMWGLVLMGATGFILMFPVVFTKVLPGVLVTASKVAHGWEAILAFLAIITWHFYNAHLAEGLFPFDKTIFTGKISRERVLEEHPLEHDRLVRAQPAASAQVLAEAPAQAPKG